MLKEHLVDGSPRKRARNRIGRPSRGLLRDVIPTPRPFSIASRVSAPEPHETTVSRPEHTHHSTRSTSVDMGIEQL